MVTLAATAYFLTCCRPGYNSSFCFCVDAPKLVNLLNYYPNKCHIRQEEEQIKCKCHDKLQDHCLSEFNSCTDDRAWSFDDQQRRKHFIDVVCQRIPLCGIKNASVIQNKEDKKEHKKEPKTATYTPIHVKPEKDKTESPIPLDIQSKDDENLETPSSLSIDCEEYEKVELPSSLEIESKEDGKSETAQSLDEESKKDENSETSPSVHIESNEDEKIDTPPSIDLELKQDEKIEALSTQSLSDVDLVPVKEKHKPPPEPESKTLPEVADPINDELIDKLDKNLANLESTFDKFVRKNKDFIQNLVGLLNFEKRKQRALEDNYNKLKHENEVLKTKNEYLKLVNVKQLELFRDELDKGISENKALYKQKIRDMEAQIQADQEKMQRYKQTERRYQDIVENKNKEIEKLRKEVKVLKEKETKLLKNYVEILNFLEEVKENLNNSEESPKKKLEATITPDDSEVDPHLIDVLKTALYNGMDTLNVRDLSILHDAIQEMNEELCHQHGFCGKNPTSKMSSIRHLSTITYEEFAPPEYMPRELETPSNLSMYPSRQRPGSDRRVQFA